jgi:hypothetical protein
VFAENRIDFSVLRDLKDQDLKDLGVVLGDRRKLLRAIANIKDKSPEVTPQPVLSSAIALGSRCTGSNAPLESGGASSSPWYRFGDWRMERCGGFGVDARPMHLGRNVPEAGINRT